MELFTNIVHKVADNPAITQMSGITDTEIGPPEIYGGNPNALNPEELFVTSINSCIMLVFYHFVKKFKVDIRSYSSNAIGKVEKTKSGLRFTHVEVKAQLSLADKNQIEKVKEIGQLAEQYCLISSSVICPVEYLIEVVDMKNQ